jgi:hypothetical protein
MQTKTQAAESQKKPYASPRLVCYGHVRAITLSGSNNAAENSVGSLLFFDTMPSDRRLKENIVRIGDHPLDIGLYLFDYKPQFRDACGHGRQFGVMADEVESVMPEAVSLRADGYRVVNYRMLGVGLGTPA